MSNKKSSDTSDTHLRVARTISIPAATDRWLTEALGPKGNLSAFVQSLIGLAQRGELSAEKLIKGQAAGTAHDHALRYMRAKEAGMSFELDVGEKIAEWCKKHRGFSVVKSRVHEVGGAVFVADYSIERGREVEISVICKSSPRAERLELALAEAIIGQSKTRKPVVIVTPYLCLDLADVIQRFEMMRVPLTELCSLGEVLTGLLAAQ